MTTRSFSLAHCALALAVVTCLALGSHASTAAGAAQAAGACGTPKDPGSGYFTSLSVAHATCATGKKVALGHYRCRRAHGVSGRCSRSVLHYSCKESRPSSGRIPTQYTAKVTCKRGSRRVVFVYQQNT